MASARGFCFRPSGNSIGSSKRRDQDTTQLPQKIDPALFHAVVIQFILGSNDGWGDRRGLEKKMRTFLVAAVFAIGPSIGPANAGDGCGPGCHSTPTGACV